MLICPHCDSPISLVTEHYIKCDADLNRIAMIGLITAEEQNIINSIRTEKRTVRAVPSPKQDATKKE